MSVVPNEKTGVTVSVPPPGAKTSMPPSQWTGGWQLGVGGIYYPTGRSPDSGPGDSTGDKPREAPKEQEKPKPAEPAKQLETPKEETEPVPGLTSEARGFKPDPSWKVVERSFRGQPTVYVDKDGIRHYSPESTMWKLGYREGGRIEKGAMIFPDAGKATTKQGQFRGGLSGEHPFVAVSTAEGVKHITQAEATKLIALSPEKQFDELQNMGIIPKKDSSGKAITWRGTEAQQQAKIKDQIQAVNILKDYIAGQEINLFAAAAAADKKQEVRQALYELGYSGSEVSDTVRKMKRLSDFRDEKGSYNLAEAINAGVPASTIITVFGRQNYNEAVGNARELKRYQDYQKATPNEKFNILMAEGKIPKGSKFESIDKDGNIVYYPPEGSAEAAKAATSQTFKELESEFLKEHPRNQSMIISLVTMSMPKKDYSSDIKQMSDSQKRKLLYEQGTPAGLRAALIDNLNLSPQERRDLSQHILTFPKAAVAPEIKTRYGRLDREQKEAVLGYYSTLESVTILGHTYPKGATPGWERLKEAGKMTAALIPGVGTAVYWNEEPIKVGGKEIPKNLERGVSIMLDALIVTAIVKPGLITGILRSLKTTPRLAKAERAISQEVKAAERALKAVDKSLVKPFKDMVKAQKAYATNLAESKEIELAIAKYGPGGEVNRAPTLATLKGQTPQLEARLKETADAFVNAQSRAAKAAYNDIPLTRSSFSTDIVNDTRNTIELMFRNIKGARGTEAQISRLVKQLNGTKNTAARAARLIQDMEKQQAAARGIRATYLKNELGRQHKILETAQQAGGKISMEIAQKQAELLIAKSGPAKKLYSELLETRAAIDEAKELVASIRRRPKAINLEIQAKNRTALLEAQKHLATLIKRESTLRNRLDEAIKVSEIEWAKPLTRGGGNILVNTRPPRFIPGQARGGATTITGTSGGAKTKANTPLLMALAGQKVRIWSKTEGGEVVIYEPRNPWISEPMPEIFTFTPGKTPYPGGLVTTAPPKPGTKPWPIHPPIPEPEPYTTTYIVEAPKIKGYGLQTRYDLQRQPEAQGAIKTSRATVTTTGVKVGTRQKTGTQPAVAPAAKQSTKTAPSTKTDVKTVTTTSTLTGTKLKAKPVASPKLFLKTTPKITTTIKTPRLHPPPEEPPPVLIKGKKGDQLDWSQVDIDSAYAWKQGFGYWARRWPFGPGDEKFFLKPPPGMKVAKDQKTAFETFQRLRGDFPEKTTADMGIMDVITEGGKIRFRRDVGQRTQSQVRLGGNGRGQAISRKRGPYYYTKGKGGTAVSRRRLRKARST